MNVTALTIIVWPALILVGFAFGQRESRKSYRLGVQHERDRWDGDGS